MILRDRLLEGFRDAFGEAPALMSRAPGRVNLIGEHTDYNDGFAMPVAIGRETQVAYRPGNAPLDVAALDFGENDRFDPAAPTRAEPGGWQNYIRGVVAELRAAGIAVPGGCLAVAGDVTKGTGLSSSASLEVAVAGALLAGAGATWDALQIALLAQRAECDFVGVRCGNLDQISAAATKQGHALLIDCRSLALSQISMPRETAVMIVQSGVVRGLLDGEYNRRRQECELAAKMLGVAALRDADLAMLEAARGVLDEVVYRRARHIITDSARTLVAARMLTSGDLAGVGALMRESHVSQAEDFGITVENTDRLAAIMNDAIGEHGGARQTGGGFGGAVIGIMHQSRVEEVRAAVLESYVTPAGTAPDIQIEQPADGLSVEVLG